MRHGDRRVTRGRPKGKQAVEGARSVLFSPYPFRSESLLCAKKGLLRSLRPPDGRPRDIECARHAPSPAATEAESGFIVSLANLEGESCRGSSAGRCRGFPGRRQASRPGGDTSAALAALRAQSLPLNRRGRRPFTGDGRKALLRARQFEEGRRFDSWMFRVVQTIGLDQIGARETR